MTAPTRARQSGFTLVELLIVVIILGLLAAIVIPQFGQTTDSAKESALAANLAAMRQAIALYRIQHNEVYPGETTADWDEFVNQLTAGTLADGTPGVIYGPYLRTGIPDNPFTDTNDGVIVATMPGAPTGGDEAYIYAPSSGELRANQAPYFTDL